MNFGQYWSAYEECSNLINSKNAENQIYILRAQCALNMGLSNVTVSDATHILISTHSKDEEVNAYNLRYQGNIQMCETQNAEQDAKKMKDKEKVKSVAELKKLMKQFESLSKNKKRNKDEFVNTMEEILKISQRCMKVIYERTDYAWESGDYRRYNELIEPISGSFPDDGNLQFRVGVSMFCNGDVAGGREHIQKNKRKQGAPKNASRIFTTMSSISKELAEVQKVIEEKNVSNISALKRKLSRSVRLVCKQNSYLEEKVEVLEGVAYRIDGVKQKAFEVFDSIIKRNPNIAFAFVQRGELNLEIDDPDAALQDFRTACRLEPMNQEAMNGIKKAEEAKTKSNRIDLYKLLEVDKSATDAEIKESYRKLVRKWHPDQFSDKSKKEEAEKRMKAINAAYELLTGQHQDAPINDDDDSDPFDFGKGYDPWEFLRNFQYMYNA